MLIIILIFIYKVDNLYKKYVVANNNNYLILKKETYENSDDIFQSTYLGDGVYSFNVRYYNGGCGFDEAINYAIDRIKG